MREPAYYRSREDWLAARRIGASDAACLLLPEARAYHGPWDVRRRLLGMDGPPDSDSSDARRGREWEPLVVGAYERATGLDVDSLTDTHALWRGPEEWATASPDGLVYADRSTGLLEAKTDRHGDARWGAGGEILRWQPEHVRDVPRAYAIQCYWQLWCCDAPWVDLACLLPYYDLRVYRIWRDPETEQRLVAAVRAWWERYVRDGAEPPADGSWACDAAIRERMPETAAAARDASAEEAALLARYLAAQEQEKAAKAEKKATGQQLLLGIGEHSGLRSPGARLSVVRQARPGDVDLDRLVEEHPEHAALVESYRKPATTAVFPRVTAVKER